MEVQNAVGDKRSHSPERGRMVKRAILFYPPSAPKNYELNPPDLLTACRNPYLFQELPVTMKNFVYIFRSAWAAHENDFEDCARNNFELMDWADNPKIEALNVQIHSTFILQLLRTGNKISSEESWNLITEYIDYTLNRCRNDLSYELFFSLLSESINLLNIQTFRVILKHRPSTFSNESAIIFWNRLSQLVLAKNLDIAGYSEGQAAALWEMFHLMTVTFGPLQIFPIFHPISLETKRFYQLLLIQPLLYAFSRHDSNLFVQLFNNPETLTLIETKLKFKVLNFWLDTMIEFDCGISSFNPEKESELISLADAVFSCITSQVDSPRFIEDCLIYNTHSLLQFILMYSPLARASIPLKSDQCKLLTELIQDESEIDNYLSIITIISGFDLKLSDIQTHFSADPRRESKCFQGLEFILQVYESFVIGPPCTVNEIVPEFDVGTESSLLYDAGRLILAKHFKIIPKTALTNDPCAEEICYRDLVWFMQFFLTKYRPDLAETFRIEIRS